MYKFCYFTQGILRVYRSISVILSLPEFSFPLRTPSVLFFKVVHGELGHYIGLGQR